MSEAEFMRSYDEFSDALFRHCYFRVFERERAKDLVQEAFTRTWEYARKKKQIENPRAFLYRVLNNLIIDESRKNRPLSLNALNEEGFDPGEDTRERLTDHMEVQEMLRVLESMPDEQRRIIVMRHIDGFGPKEIAEALGLTENIVSVRLHRAVQQLRKLRNHHGR
jgi:RNA polymerase sigma-70 factor (ECF subfamily)